MTITIYTTSVCAACQSLGDWLHKNDFDFTKKIVDTSDATMAEFLAVSDGMISVPFSVISYDDGTETKISGFDRKAFQSALHIP